MDIVTLANQVVQALAPFMPFLGGIGGGIGAAIVSKVGEDVYDQGKKQGKRLYQVVEERFEQEKTADHGSASRALQNFVYEPDKYQDVFKTTLLPLLQADPAFANQVRGILETSPALQQIMRGGNYAVLRNNQQTNTAGSGSQIIEVGDGGTAEGNKQDIRYE